MIHFDTDRKTFRLQGKDTLTVLAVHPAGGLGQDIVDAGPQTQRW